MAKLIAYVDGSYRDGVYGAGAVILDENREEVKRISESGNDPMWAQMQNVTGEVFATMEAVKYALAVEADEIDIYHDYIGIRNWTLPVGHKDRWQAKKKGSQVYKYFMDQVKAKYNLKINFIKVKAHSGDYYNELADKLARSSLC